MLNIVSSTTYSELKDKIAMELGIDPTQQRIKHGFPPKQMSIADDDVLSLIHGDRIIVEIIKEKTQGRHNFLELFFLFICFTE